MELNSYKLTLVKGQTHTYQIELKIKEELVYIVEERHVYVILDIDQLYTS